ncbi:unnamed protein product [Cuscuta epithymum]|uniref:DNA mismatch repair protein MLH3 n=2 Tax=Cuscuta epithymum TaxID=186058 RepID=A0AAV0FDL6_9ASTE|nr:unnamed protein product [Cuscuta epithymum]
MRSVEKLPEDTRSAVRSGVILYDLTRVVEELVYNSLDACADKVSISVGVRACYVQVVDNGSGVSRDGLDLLGERYATSKYDPLDGINTSPLSFGYRGEALSSIADVSLVEIITKAHGRPNGYRKVLKGCKCLYLGIDGERLDVGTTVTVCDLFYNQPVRRKHMLSNSKKVLHMIKECVLRIALVQPNVSFRVVDIESEDVLLHTCPSPSPLSQLARSFGIEASSSLEELNDAAGQFKLSGYVSGIGDISSWKVVQYAYINSRFISKGQIHKAINNLAASFTIGYQIDTQNRSQICPSFLLNLQCPKSCYDLTFEPSRTSVEFKDWDSVLAFIRDAVGRLWSRGKSVDFPVDCEVGKKRRQVLNCLVPEGTPPKSRKLVEEFNNSIASRQIPSSPANFNVFVTKKLNADCRFVCQTDHPDQESDISPSHCREMSSGQCNSHRWIHNMCSPGDSYLNNDHFCLCRSYGQANSFFCSEWGGSSSKIDADTDRLYAGQATPSNSLELIDNLDVRKPFLQNCFLRSTLKRADTFLVTDEELEFKIDGNSKQSALRADDRVVEEVNGINRTMNPTNVWHNEKPDVLSCFKTTMRQDATDYVRKPFLKSCFIGRTLKRGETPLATDEEFEFEVEGHSKQSAYRSDGIAVEEIDHSNKIMCQWDTWCDEQPDVLSFSKTTTQYGVSEEVRKPFIQSCILGRRLKQGETALATDEEFEIEVDHHLKRSAFRADGKAVEEIDDINKIMSQRNLWCNEQPHSLIFSNTPKPYDIQDIHRINFFLGDSVNSTLNPELSVEDGLFLPDFVKPFQRYDYCPHSDTTHEDLVENCFEYNGNLRYESANTVTKNWKYDLNNISIGPEMECFLTSSKSLFSDVKDHTAFKDTDNDFQEHDLNDAFSRSRLNISTYCINNRGEGGIRNSCTSRHNFSSIGFDWESNTVVRPRNLSKMLVPYRRGRRCKSAPPFYRNRKKFSAISNFLKITAGKINLQTFHDGTGLPETHNLKQLESRSEVNSMRPSNQYDQSTTLYCEGTSFCDDIPEVGIISIDARKCSSKLQMDSCEELTLRKIQDTAVCGKEQNSHHHISSRSGSRHLKDQDTILDIASGILHLASRSIVPHSLEKNCLESAKVLQQVDKKFIPIVAGRTLALIDQHAADERIRVEELRRKVLSGKMRTTTYLDCEQDLVVPETGFQLLHDYAEQIQEWGWICNINTQGSRPFVRNLNIMNKKQAIATLLAVPCILGVKLSDVDLIEFLQQLDDTDGSSTIPPSVLRVLNNKACRGAIMFGDELLPSECSLIVEELQQTSLCFQCAHGRPTMVPLVNLEALREEIEKMKSRSSKSWHGLRRHGISLERMQRRLLNGG